MEQRDLIDVWRMERASDGRGPYGTVFVGSDEEDADVYGSWSRPMPDSDVPGWQGWGKQTCYHFGFTSFAQFKAWWTQRARRKAHDAGYVCAVYRITRDKVMCGSRQCAFVRAEAELVETFGLLDVDLITP